MSLAAWVLCALVLSGADDTIIMMDDGLPQSPPVAPTYTPIPRLQMRAASRMSSNLSGAASASAGVSGLEWWTLARARASLDMTADLSAVFEAWVRWGAIGLAMPGHFYGVNIRDVYWQSDVQLREAYLSWTLGRTALRAGARLFVWGKNELFAPADVLNPYDVRYDLFAAFASPKDMRVPVWALDATYHADWGDVQLVLQPFFTGHKVFLTGHDLSVTALGGPYAGALALGLQGLSHGARDAFQQGLQGTSLPSQGPAGFSAALRVGGHWQGWDMAATAYIGWDRTPWVVMDPDAATLASNANTIAADPSVLPLDPNLQGALAGVGQKTAVGMQLVRATYRHTGMLAFEAETALDPVVLKIDVGYAPGQTFYTQSMVPVFLHNVRAVVGVDYTRDEMLFISGSVFAQSIFAPPHGHLLLGLEPLHENPNRKVAWLYGVTGTARWELWQDRLAVQALASVTPKPSNYVAYAQVAYVGWQPHNLALGTLWVGGQSGTLGADYAHNRFVMVQYEGAW